MTVTKVRKDIAALTFAIDAEFDASPERVWQLWADPRQLERWWGPPTYPATFTGHDLTAGGRADYHMTGPEGDQPRGYWEIVEVDPPRSLVFRDGFADADGSPNPELPTMTARVTIEDTDGGRARMSMESTFPDAASMQQVLAMGMEEGIREAVGQIDAILEEPQGGPPEPESQVLDVRREPPATRHAFIFDTYGALRPGESFELVNDHDPKPLYYQLAAEQAGTFSWDYLEEGPLVWRVRIGRVADGGPSPS